MRRYPTGANPPTVPDQPRRRVFERTLSPGWLKVQDFGSDSTVVGSHVDHLSAGFILLLLDRSGARRVARNYPLIFSQGGGSGCVSGLVFWLTRLQD